MTHYDVSFRLQHDCPYNSFSRKHPEVVISHWCNLSRDVLEISHRNVKTETVQRSIGVLVKELGTRGGDYFWAATDPATPNTFWVSGEFRTVSLFQGWSTQVGEISFNPT